MKGFLNLEAMIALLSAIAILSLLIGSMQSQLEKLEAKNSLMNSQIDAISCAQQADSVYSNNLIQINTKLENCFVENNKIISVFGTQKIKSKTLAKNISINPTNKNIQVSGAKHYW
ncbi:MAG: hypothetical protein Q7S21_00620 [archaeon]|nr:hypothetical protein [archaeon]